MYKLYTHGKSNLKIYCKNALKWGLHSQIVVVGGDPEFGEMMV